MPEGVESDKQKHRVGPAVTPFAHPRCAKIVHLGGGDNV
jgi:hypothetical protein